MMNKLIIACIVLIASLSAFAAASPGYPLAVVDSAGREVVFSQPQERVIVLNSDAAEAVCILGASDKIVGVVDSIQSRAYDFPDLLDMPLVGSWKEFNYEEIGEIAREGGAIPPDIVVIGYVYEGKENGIEAVAEHLAPMGNISILGLDIYKEENLSRELTILGQVLDREEVAEEYLEWHDRMIADVEAAVEGNDSPTVYIEGTANGLGELTTFGGSSAQQALLDLAGGSNVMTEEIAYPKVEWEWVVERNPDVILKMSYLSPADGISGWGESDMGDLDAIMDEIKSRPGAEGLSAVKTGRVYIVFAQVLFGLDNVAGLSYLAEALHPEIDLNPRGVLQEYLDRRGLEMSEDRIFVYPA